MKNPLPTLVSAAAALCAATMIHSMLLAASEHIAFGEPGGAEIHGSVADLELTPPRFVYVETPPRWTPDFPFPLMEPEEPREKAVPFTSLRRPARQNSSIDADRARFKAILWLERTQLPDGGWPSDASVGASCLRETSLAVLALLGDGNTHLSKRVDRDAASGQVFLMSQVMRAALKWLLAHTPDPKARPLPDLSPDEFALAALAMTEAREQTGSALFEQSAADWRELTRRAQLGNESTGASPQATAWAMLALNVAREDTPAGVSRKILGEAGVPTLVREALAVSIELTRDYTDPEGPWRSPLEALEERPIDVWTLSYETCHWLSLASRQGAVVSARSWERFRKELFDVLVEHQLASGDWNPPSDSRFGRVAITALNALTLETETRYTFPKLGTRPNRGSPAPF